ncbi:MAG: tetratricopeptide repeat protein [Leptolyngbya sp. SIO3F4]|nr:tetratricopeptide repeat protein [Leptolyngbya sp. SIO3F4]
MRQFLLGLLVWIPCVAFGQNGASRPTVTEATQEELMLLIRELFETAVQFSLNVSSQDLKSTYADIPDGRTYDQDYLSDLLEKLESDNGNPLYLNNLGDYYANTNNFELARLHYSEALEHLDISYLNNDSAFYYSLRGLLKANLNDSTAVEDFDRSVELNPNDSITLYFYPLILVSSARYKKAKKVSKKLLAGSESNRSIPYLYLMFAEVMESYRDIFESGSNQTQWKQELAGKNYNEIVDFALLDKYAKKYPDDTEIQNCRLMADFFALFSRMTLFEKDSNYKLILGYNAYEKAQIQEIIERLGTLKKEKKLNPYTATKCLGYAHFMLGEWDTSIDYFEKAIERFPQEKVDPQFRSDECYEAITTIHFERSDTTRFRESLYTRIEVEAKPENTQDELTLLAFDHYRSGDLEKAEEYCTKIREINPDNFDALRLLAHLNFLREHYALTEFYAESASRYLRNDLDQYNLTMQFAVYFMYRGDFDTAKKNIEIGRTIQGDAGCSLCDQLVNILEENEER